MNKIDFDRIFRQPRLDRVPVNSSLRGNMARCCEHAANGHSKPKLGRIEIVRQYSGSHARTLMFEKARSKGGNYGKPLRRIANIQPVRKTKTHEKGFHVAGHGILPLSLGELKIKLGSLGFVAFRRGTEKTINPLFA